MSLKLLEGTLSSKLFKTVIKTTLTFDVKNKLLFEKY